MVDPKKPEDDGYTFSELDDFNLNPEESSLGEEKETPYDENKLPPKQKTVNVRRNALIAIAVVACLMLGYKFVEAFLQRKHTPSQKSQVVPAPTAPVSTPAPSRLSTPVVTPQPQPAPKPVETHVAPTTAPTPTSVTVDNTPVLRQLMTVETQQQALRSSIEGMQTALSGINSHENELAEKMTELTQALTALVSKLDQQTIQVEHLVERARCRSKKVKRYRPKIPTPVYTIQAVIPGRAWLISENGATLTINVGTSLRGYGVVKLIDAKQGRVHTSSGRVIRFSQ